jgi:hypothetical protein
MVTEARVVFSDPDADSVRAHFRAVVDGDTGTTPWVSDHAQTIPVLGLRPSTAYILWAEAKRGAASALGDTLSFATAALPAALAGARLVRTRGGLPSGGYTLTSTMSADGHVFAVAFDRNGSVCWYRDLGFPDAVGDVQQQRNGHVTVAVGRRQGYYSPDQHFVEYTRTGDSVRTFVATGSPYTDGHDLILVPNAAGTPPDRYLFGYDVRTTDLTAFGGGPADSLAGHQVLHITPGGVVDTVIQGWDHWTENDAIIGPRTVGDFDHPNSLAFDRDSGLIVSYRNLGSVVKVAPHSHTIAWVLGGTHNQFTFVGDPQGGFGGQHSVKVLPNGNLLMFDNGWPHSPQASRAVEYKLDVNARVATMVWQYAPQPSIFTPFTGAVQRLSNGNTVVTFTMQGIIDEVSRDGALVSRMTMYNGSTVYAPYRTQRIGSLYGYRNP